MVEKEGSRSTMDKSKIMKRFFDVIIYTVVIALAFVTVYPMYYVLINSISEPAEVIKGGIYWLPRGFSLEAFKNIAAEAELWRSYAYTIFYIVTQTVLMEITCLLVAYPLTSKRLIGRKFVVWFLLVPMYFSGGMIATYLVYSRYGLYNNVWALIIPGSYSVYNIILVRTFLTSEQEGIREAAKIVGLDDYLEIQQNLVDNYKKVQQG